MTESPADSICAPGAEYRRQQHRKGHGGHERACKESIRGDDRVVDVETKLGGRGQRYTPEQVHVHHKEQDDAVVVQRDSAHGIARYRVSHSSSCGSARCVLPASVSQRWNCTPVLFCTPSPFPAFPGELSGKASFNLLPCRSEGGCPHPKYVTRSPVLWVRFQVVLSQAIGSRTSNGSACRALLPGDLTVRAADKFGGHNPKERRSA